MESQFRNLPSVNDVLDDERVSRLVQEFSHEAVLGLVRTEIDRARDGIRNGDSPLSLDVLADAVERRAAALWGSMPTPVINATGVILHTNLGRAPLSDDAMEAMRAANEGYGDLEFDLETGRRGSRQGRVAQLLCQLTGAEGALVVNNNASAVLLGLAAVANGKEVIVSRGEAVEIGGGFRIPDVLRQSGATLVEVGTTNKTYTRDYEAAITEDTGAILSVHASNFRVMGFTHMPTLTELVELGARSDVPVLHDLGSGCLLDTTRFGLAHEPMPQESIGDGASLAVFSGDKLLGGPQAGIIIGKKELIDVVSRHPLARAVRIDKGSLAALNATLLHYLKDEAASKIPIWEMISRSPEFLAQRAESWRLATDGPTSVVPGESTVGGGSLPGETLPTSLLSIDATEMPGGASALAASLRRGTPPIVGRIDAERVLLDPRTVPQDLDDVMVRGIFHAL
ncbi:MAG: L-seryl-tRNA(Sec) selenium transferase [Chloroflexota bacterium]|nr:L-seryl-tRNA(Sec) selenium transferase [Chloroflexota bacterium]